MGGVQVAHDHVFVYGHIRAGRAAVDENTDDQIDG